MNPTDWDTEEVFCVTTDTPIYSHVKVQKLTLTFYHFTIPYLISLPSLVYD